MGSRENVSPQPKTRLLDRDDLVSVRIVTSLREVRSSDWDALAGSNALASYGWLLASEEGRVRGLEPHYVLVSQDSELAAAAVCYVCRPGSRIFDPDHLMFRRLRRIPALLRISFLPAIMCCPYRCRGRHLMVNDRLEGASRQRVLAHLLDAVERLAGSARLPLWFPRLTDEEELAAALVSRRSYHRTREHPATVMDIEWDSFDGYLASLRKFSKKMPGVVRNEINRNRKAGVVIKEIHDPRVHRDRLYDLANRHYFRLNGRRVPYTGDYLPKLKEYLGDDLILYGAFREGSLVGFSTLVKKGTVAHVDHVGVDREATRGDFTYFNITYYRPILDAIHNGIKKIYFGAALYRTKARRGCRTLRLQDFYKSASGVRHFAVRPYFAFHTSWMGWKLAGLENPERLRRSEIS